MKKLGNVIIPASVSASAALLSGLTGFFSGVTPGVVLVRAVAAALLAGLFVFLADWLVKNYLPELKSINDSGEADSSAGSGGRVNIVMPDEMPGTAGSESDSGIPGENPLVVPSESGDAGNNEIAESSDILHNNKPEESDLADAVGGEVDTLPNLDSLEISLDSSSEEVGDAGQVDSVSPEPSSASGPNIGPGGNEDPETIAKAVKTVLARDQHK